MRYAIELAYSGKNFHGWQIQKNARTVQQYLEECMSILLKEKISLTGAGRTDTGVHASYYVAHFDTSKSINTEKYSRKLNRFLSNEINLFSVIKCHPDFHARFDAISRTYKYIINTQKNPWIKDLCYSFNQPLDIDTLNICSALLLEYKDFSSFAKLHSDNKTNICTIEEAFWIRDNDFYIFTIKANRFLRNMVRAITGTLIDTGTGKISKEDFIKIIESKNNQLASKSAPAQGLYLYDIEYKNSDFSNPVKKKALPFI